MGLYDELLAQFDNEKLASDSSKESVKGDLGGLDNNELLSLAEEISKIAGDNDLAEMAKILPVYASGAQGTFVEDKIPAEETYILGANNDTTAPYDDNSDVIKSAAEKEDSEEKDSDEKKEEDKDSEEKEDKEEEDKEDKKEASYTEQLRAILKEAAAVEEQLEDSITKEAAEDAVSARAIVDEAAKLIAPTDIKAHEYSEQMMDKVKTIAATDATTMTEAATALATEVVDNVKAAFEYLEELEKTADVSYDEYGMPVVTPASQYVASPLGAVLGGASGAILGGAAGAYAGLKNPVAEGAILKAEELAARGKKLIYEKGIPDKAAVKANALQQVQSVIDADAPKFKGIKGSIPGALVGLGLGSLLGATALATKEASPVEELLLKEASTVTQKASPVEELLINTINL